MKPLRIHFHRPRLTRKLVLRLAVVMVPLVWLYTTHVIPPVFEIIDKNEFLAKFQTTPQMRAEVVENLARQMEQHYVDAARGKKAAYRIRYKLQKGGYDELLNQRNFTDELTMDVRGDTDDDRNLRVVFVANVIPQQLDGSAVVDARTAWDAQAEGTEVNTLGLVTATDGVPKYEVMKGNVGYMKVIHFNGGAAASKKFAEVMEALHDTQMLVLDLRDNSGGDSASAVELAGYFFAQPMKLAAMETRTAPDKWVRETFVSKPAPSNLAYLKQPVILLTSRETVSAGELLAFVLKQHGRVKILGESTRGGSHPAIRVRLDDHFGATIPNARIFDPQTNTSWETSGVIPDRYLLAYQALEIVKRELQFKGAVKTTPDK